MWKDVCFDSVAEQFTIEYKEITCSEDSCNQFNYSKNIDKIKYNKKLNQTLEETITSESKVFAKQQTNQDYTYGYCGIYKQIKFTTKYVEEESIATIPITVYLVYCQKIPKTCR